MQPSPKKRQLEEFALVAKAGAQMKGYGGMLTLELDGGYEDAVRAVDRLADLEQALG